MSFRWARDRLGPAFPSKKGTFGPVAMFGAWGRFCAVSSVNIQMWKTARSHALRAQRDAWQLRRRSRFYVVPYRAHWSTPCVIAALTSVVHDGQGAANYHHQPRKNDHHPRPMI